MPKVSVIIPTYNSEKYVGQAIESVLSQTYQDFELIVVDDGSTDNTRTIVKNYGEKVRYIYQQNKGPAGARNTGIAASSGKYIALLDADDLWLPHKLELQVKLFNSRRKVGLVYSDTYRFSENGNPLDKDRAFLRKKPYAGNVLKELIINNFVPTLTVIISKEAFNKVGVFNENRTFFATEDYELWLRIAAHYEFDYIDEPLTRWRYHDSNIHRCDTRFKVREQMLLSNLTILTNLTGEKSDQIKEMHTIINRKLGQIQFDLGKVYLFTGSMSKARERFIKAINLYPAYLYSYLYLLLSFLGYKMTKRLRKFKRVISI